MSLIYETWWCDVCKKTGTLWRVEFSRKTMGELRKEVEEAHKKVSPNCKHIGQEKIRSSERLYDEGVPDWVRAYRQKEIKEGGPIKL
jgi:ubiquinone/menaquinone biosynthesis C-methylase UbiE